MLIVVARLSRRFIKHWLWYWFWIYWFCKITYCEK